MVMVKGDDSSMTSSQERFKMDDDDVDNGSSCNNKFVYKFDNTNNTSFSQIQSRRFQHSSNNVPCFASFCPSMDLIALGMRNGCGSSAAAATSNTLDGLMADNTAEGSNNHFDDDDDDEYQVIAESIVVHRILSWQSLLHLKIDQLTSTSPDCFDVHDGKKTADNDDDSDNDILCTDDVERASVFAIVSAAKLSENRKDVSSNTRDSNPSSSSLQLPSWSSTGSSREGATCIIWSPDGRYIAVGLVDGGVLIHSVEPDAVRADGGIMTRGGGGGINGLGGTRGAGGMAASVGGDDEEDGHCLGMHFIRPPSLSSILPHIWKQKQPSQQRLEHEQPASLSRRVTRSMAEKRERNTGEGVMMGKRGENMEQSMGASLLPSSSSSLKENSVIVHPPTLAVVGMTWNQLIPQKRRCRRGCRRSSPSPPCDNNGTYEDSVQYHEDRENVKFAKDEMDIRESWRYTSQLIDKGIGHFLPNTFQPPTAKKITFQQQRGLYLERGGGREDGLVAHLNVLCVATTKDIHLYLQGQYRILSVPHGFSFLSVEDCRHEESSSSPGGGGGDGISDGGTGGGIDMICSPDLSTLLAVETRPRQSLTSMSSRKATAKLFSSTLLPRQRFELQYLSASYRSLFSHLWDARRSIRAASVSWKTALRPIDLKFSGLVKLLSDYGVKVGSGSDSIRLEFLRFILSGRSSVSGGKDSSSSSSASAALDQFFTRPQMHDMLLQKEFRGVEVSLSSTEVLLRSRVLHSIRAVVYEAEEFYGMACAWQEQEIHSLVGDLIDVDTALNLYNAARVLYLSFNQCLGYIVEARTRVNDILAWMRATAARVRAWGTAPDSIQRKNAKALRVSNGVVQRVAAFLSSPMTFALKDGATELEHRSLTECVIGVPLSDFLAQRKLHQISMVAENAEKRIESVQGTNIVQNLGSIVQLMFQINTILFDQPRRVFADSVTSLGICFEVQHSLVAIHARRGAGCSDSGDANGYFLPKLNEDHPFIVKCLYWLILARVIGSKIEFIAIPSCAGFKPEFFLRTELMLPKGCDVTNVAFYGDDGHSSLSPNLNENSEVKEGRQAVGLVVKLTSLISQDVREELWVTRYDDLLFKKYDFNMNSKNEALIHGTKSNEEACATPIFIGDSARDEDAIIPKRRVISTHQKQRRQQPTQFCLCGSRGTGGVVTFAASIALNILDLEEDEECSSEIDDVDE